MATCQGQPLISNCRLAQGRSYSTAYGRTVIWYNDIEEGFNRSRYTAYGSIDDYWCNQDELELTVQYLMSALEQGSDLLRLVRNPAKVPR
jgi:hypothetical protein